jgi:hypothetical protein
MAVAKKTQNEQPVETPAAQPEPEPEPEPTVEPEQEVEAEPEPEPFTNAPPEFEAFDLVGEDGRRIHRTRSRLFCEEERTRITAETGEKLEIVPASPFGTE